jgi:ABC-type Na+ efflux pump permease subunit
MLRLNPFITCIIMSQYDNYHLSVQIDAKSLAILVVCVATNAAYLVLAFVLGRVCRLGSK